MNGTVPLQAFIASLDPAIIWMLVGLVGLVLEVLVPAFVIGPFGLAAFVAAGAAWLGASLPVQLVIFGVGGVVLVIPARRYLARSARAPGLGAGALPGKVATCLEPIDGDAQGGVVSLDGARWSAIAERGTRIAAGARVEVSAIQGVRLLVAPSRDRGAP